MNKLRAEFIEVTIINVSYSLRNSRNSIKLIKNLTVEDINKGEFRVQNELFNFICDLIGDPDYPRKKLLIISPK